MARHLETLQGIRRILMPGILMLVVSFAICPQDGAALPIGLKTEAQAGKDNQTSESPAMKDQHSQSSSAISSTDERQAKIEEDTKRLYQLSAELRAEVARTYKESLSLTVLKKAEEIEKLAKSLKILMNKEASTAKR